MLPLWLLLLDTFLTNVSTWLGRCRYYINCDVFVTVAICLRSTFNVLPTIKKDFEIYLKANSFSKLM